MTFSDQSRDGHEQRSSAPHPSTPAEALERLRVRGRAPLVAPAGTSAAELAQRVESIESVAPTELREIPQPSRPEGRPDALPEAIQALVDRPADPLLQALCAPSLQPHAPSTYPGVSADTSEVEEEDTWPFAPQPDHDDPDTDHDRPAPLPAIPRSRRGGFPEAGVARDRSPVAGARPAPMGRRPGVAPERVPSVAGARPRTQTARPTSRPRPVATTRSVSPRTSAARSSSSVTTLPKPAQLASGPDDEKSDNRAALSAFGVLAILAVALLVAAALAKSGDEPAPISSPRQNPSAQASGLAPVQPDEPGITSIVTFGPGTDILTRQHLVFTQPVTQVPILVPQRTARLSVFDDVVVDHVEVRINGKVVRDRLGEFRPGDRRAVALPAVTDTADISYVIHGGLVRTVPLSAKNGLALVNPVSVAPGSLLKITTQLTGTGIGVTNLGCMGADGRSEACGSQKKRTWTVTQAGKNRSMDVIAQLALP